MRDATFYTICLCLVLSLSCSKDESIPHRDCLNGITTEFPFSFSKMGKLIDKDPHTTSTLSFHDDGTFDFYYKGKCTVDTLAAFCRNEEDQLKIFELNMSGTWNHHQRVQVVSEQVPGPCFFGCEPSYTYSLLTGTCDLTIEESLLPIFLNTIASGNYSMDCNGVSILIRIPDSPEYIRFIF